MVFVKVLKIKSPAAKVDLPIVKDIGAEVFHFYTPDLALLVAAGIPV